MTLHDFKHRLLPITLSQCVGLACGILGVRFTTHWIEPGDYGRYAVFLTCVSLGMWVFHAGLVKAVGRLWAASPDHRALLNRVWRAMGGRRLFWFTLALLALSAATERAEWPLHFPLMAASALALSALSVLQGALQARRAHWEDLTVTLASSSSRSFLPPLAYLLSGGSSVWMRAGFLVHTLAAAAVSYFWIRPNLKRNSTENSAPGPSLDAYMGGWFLMLSLSHWVLNGLNRWVAAAAFGSDFAGQFTLASNIAMIPTSMFGVIVLQFFQPGLYALPHETAAERAAVARRADAIAVGYSAIAIVGLVIVRYVAPMTTGVVIGEAYLPALPMIGAAGSFIAAVTLLQVFQLPLLAARREHLCGPVEVGGSAVLVIGCAGAAWLGGVSGFLWSLYAAPVVVWVAVRAGFRKRLGHSETS